jgi:hypothetical protein
VRGEITPEKQKLLEKRQREEMQKVGPKTGIDRLNDVWAKIDADRARGEGPKFVTQTISPEKRIIMEKRLRAWAKVDADRARGEGPKIVSQTISPETQLLMKRRLREVVENEERKRRKNLEAKQEEKNLPTRQEWTVDAARAGVLPDDVLQPRKVEEKVKTDGKTVSPSDLRLMEELRLTSWEELVELRNTPGKLEAALRDERMKVAYIGGENLMLSSIRLKMFSDEQDERHFRGSVLTEEDLEREKELMQKKFSDSPGWIMSLRSGAKLSRTNERCTIARCDDTPLVRRMMAEGVDWEKEVDYQLDFLSPVDGETRFKKAAAVLAKKTHACFPLFAAWDNMPSSVCNVTAMKAISQMEDEVVRIPVGLKAADGLLRKMKNVVRLFVKIQPRGFLYLTRLVFYHASARAVRHLRKFIVHCPDIYCKNVFRKAISVLQLPSGFPWSEWLKPYIFGVPYTTLFLGSEASKCSNSSGGERLCEYSEETWIRKAWNGSITKHDLQIQREVSVYPGDVVRSFFSRREFSIEAHNLREHTPWVSGKIVGDLKRFAYDIIRNGYLIVNSSVVSRKSNEASDCLWSCGIPWLEQSLLKDALTLKRLKQFGYLRYLKWLCVTPDCEELVESEKGKILQDNDSIYTVSMPDGRDQFSLGELKRNVFATPVSKFPYVLGLVFNSIALATTIIIALFYRKMWRDLKLVTGLAVMIILISVAQLIFWPIARNSLHKAISPLLLASLDPWLKANVALAWTDVVGNCAVLVAAAVMFYQWAGVVIALKGKDEWERRFRFILAGAVTLFVLVGVGLLIRLTTRHNNSYMAAKQTVALIMLNAMTFTSLTTLTLALVISIQLYVAVHLWKEGKKQQVWFVVKEIILLLLVVSGLGLRIGFQATYAYQNDTIMFYLNYLLAQALIVVPVIVLVFLAFSASKNRLNGAPVTKTESSYAASLLEGDDEYGGKVPAAYQDF